MALLFVFIDGIGVGDHSENNPLSSSDLKSFSWFTGSNGFHNKLDEVIAGDKLYKTIDANLGVPGLPQSGTGQAALLSGENAPELAGRHFGPFPHSRNKDLLKQRSLFHQAIRLGFNPHFLNAYPEIFFKKSEKRSRWTCTTLMSKSAGLKLNSLDDVLEDRAITAEITQKAWREMLHLDVPEITPEQAARRALESLKFYDLSLFEYYLTDKAGHEMDPVKANRVLGVLDDFLFHILQNLNSDDTLVITSDHGNLEDISIKTHTRNPVPLFVKGDTESFRICRSIMDITPAILETLQRGRK
jgi:2,3-bisphosphoglycerate-independent phosphoglycerate mutase